MPHQVRQFDCLEILLPGLWLLTLAAIIDGKILCVHGGLSPEIRMLDWDPCALQSTRDSPRRRLCDLVWSDPDDVETWAVSPRGAGWIFGSRVAREFNHLNNLQLIARAHQLVMEGFKYHFPERDVVTVWSAPNYCYRCGNVASVMKVAEDLSLDFPIFSATFDEPQSSSPPKNNRSEYFYKAKFFN